MNAKNEPAFSELFGAFFRLGLTAFGGPAMIAFISELAIKQKGWLDRESFKQGTVLCQSLPGATAMQVAAYVGLRARGFWGGLIAYIGFGLPACMIMLLLSNLYLHSREIGWVQSIFAGLQVLVVALVGSALVHFGRAILRNWQDGVLALLAAASFWFGLSAVVIILGAAAMGLVLFTDSSEELPVSPMKIDTILYHYCGGCILLLLGAMGIIHVFSPELFALAAVMLKIDTFAFGGGFSSVPLMLQEVVHSRGWMDQKTFMDGIALGQITPGPIVITATFVGLLAQQFSGAVVATFAIFTPSFLILVMAVPVLDRLQHSRKFKMASRGILASFVGLLLFVTFRFASGISWDTIRVIVLLGAFAALLKKVNILYILPVCCLVSFILLR